MATVANGVNVGPLLQKQSFRISLRGRPENSRSILATAHIRASFPLCAYGGPVFSDYNSSPFTLNLFATSSFLLLPQSPQRG